MTKLIEHAQALYKKVERRAAQHTLNRLLDQSSLCHQKLGTRYGGWFVPNGLLSNRSLCYGLGTSEDVSFKDKIC